MFCFLHVLTVVNNPAVECRHFFEILVSILLDTYPKMGMLNHIIDLLLIFGDIAVVPFYIPTSVQGFQLIHILTNSFCLSYFNSYPDRYEVIAQYGLILGEILLVLILNLVINDIEHLFIHPLDTCLSLEKYLFKSLAHSVTGLFVICVCVCFLLYPDCTGSSLLCVGVSLW